MQTTASSEWQVVLDHIRDPQNPRKNLGTNERLMLSQVRARWGEGAVLLLDWPEVWDTSTLDLLSGILYGNLPVMLKMLHATDFDWGAAYKVEPEPELKPAPPPALDASFETWLKTGDVLEAMHRQELGDAEILAKLYTDRVCFDHSERQWYLWSGNLWQRDRTKAVERLVSGPVAAQFQFIGAKLRRSAQTEAEIEQAEALWKRAASLRFRSRIFNVLALAQSQPDLALTGDEWDHNPMLLGVDNGILNLEYGDLLPGQPRDYIRQAAPTRWEGLDAPAPRWDRFLQEVFGHDQELIDFVQRLFGYGITGLSIEHVFPVLQGWGRNGKDSLLETLRNVLGGSLAGPVSNDVMMMAYRNTGSATPHLYSLRGKRLVWSSESTEGARLNAARVKMLCGGNTIVARPLYGSPVEFRPSHLLLLVTNFRPHCNSDDFALWKRLLLVPFMQTFIDDPNPDIPTEHQRDPYISLKLTAEAAGILAWLVRGCLAWQEQGLNPPEVVRLATSEYQSEEDTLALFFGALCTLGEDKEVGANELYMSYVDWSKGHGARPMSQTAFGSRMKRRFSHKRKMDGVVYYGLGLRAKVDLNF